MRLVRQLLDVLAVSQQHRGADVLLDELLHGPEDPRVIAFRKRDPRHAPARAGDDHAHHFVRPPLPPPQRLCVPVALQGDERPGKARPVLELPE